MQAAGKDGCMLASWSSIKETRGDITIERPLPRAMDERMYVKDFPEAVSATKRVDFPLRILMIVYT